MRPGTSIEYSVVGQKTLDQTLASLKATDMDGRYPIIGYGSNANPAQLQRKFPKEDNPVIPVLKAVLEGFDVVYANSFSKHGYAPATLIHSPGTRVDVWVTMLDGYQLKHMDKTEGRGKTYCMADLKSTVRLANEAKLPAYSYIHVRGALTLNKKPVRLGPIHVDNPTYQAMNQEEILHKISEWLRLDYDPKSFSDCIKENWRDYRVQLKERPSITMAHEKLVYPHNPPTMACM